ncbi:hypothetical protein AOLI_G00322140 [Acnodon oligacanthus]
MKDITHRRQCCPGKRGWGRLDRPWQSRPVLFSQALKGIVWVSLIPRAFENSQSPLSSLAFSLRIRLTSGQFTGPSYVTPRSKSGDNGRVKRMHASARCNGITFRQSEVLPEWRSSALLIRPETENETF